MEEIQWPPSHCQTQPTHLHFESPSVFARIFSEKSPHVTGQKGENFVSRLYEEAGWQIVARRFRVRGSEIDLAVMNKSSMQARIIEVKTRQFKRLDLASAEMLMSQQKLHCLRLGARHLDDQMRRQGLELNWSVDVVLLSKEKASGSIKLTTWVNAFDL